MTSFQYEFDNFQSLGLGNMITTGAINATGMIPPFFPEHVVSLLVHCGSLLHLFCCFVLHLCLYCCLLEYLLGTLCLLSKDPYMKLTIKCTLNYDLNNYFATINMIVAML